MIDAKLRKWIEKQSLFFVAMQALVDYQNEKNAESIDRLPAIKSRA